MKKRLLACLLVLSMAVPFVAAEEVQDTAAEAPVEVKVVEETIQQARISVYG